MGGESEEKKERKQNLKSKTNLEWFSAPSFHFVFFLLYFFYMYLLHPSFNLFFSLHLSHVFLFYL